MYLKYLQQRKKSSIKKDSISDGSKPLLNAIARIPISDRQHECVNEISTRQMRIFLLEELVTNICISCCDFIQKPHDFLRTLFNSNKINKYILPTRVCEVLATLKNAKSKVFKNEKERNRNPENFWERNLKETE